MKINLEDLVNNLENKVTLEFKEVINELENDEPVIGIVTVMLTPYGVEVTGSVETNMTFECDRCMKAYPYHLKIDLNEELIRESIVDSETKEYEITRGNFVEELKGRKEIDVTDIIYQDIILNIPGKKLCDKKCIGSEELQKVKSEKSLDPRMQVFKKFFEKNND
ncbi:MAG: DUF177 domain-containing protein [Candidatus Gastranaerophilales bacterium]|nr:DUF177 domain-containing protein [Candidatus Gastranaerophilales bacterium]